MPSRIPTYRSRSEIPNPNVGKPTLCIDFHGVIHSHVSANRSREIDDDPPVTGAFDFLERAVASFRVCIICARFAEPGEAGLVAMKSAREWMLRHGFKTWGIGLDPFGLHPIYLSPIKPPCTVLLDDRAVTFTGVFPDPADLVAFKPWNKA